jgi:ribosome-interacting GTPase 1
LVGPPNVGKSALVARLTHADPEVADYPFTTREPLPGMMPFEDIAFQLIDLPPLSDEYVEPWVFDLIRAADMLWVVVESSNSLDGLEQTQRLLAEKKIDLCPVGAPPAEDPGIGRTGRASLLVVTGQDKPDSSENLQILEELLDQPWPTLPVSVVDGQGLHELGRRSFEALEIIRVYTKQPGKAADRDKPFTLPRGSTIAELSRTIHNDVAERLKFARIWGEHVFDGQTVQREHALEDGDIVELHT